MTQSPLDSLAKFDPAALISQYEAYLDIRARFLLERLDRYKDFPGIHTGYDSITGRDFPAEDLLSYSWINGRGACVLVRFAELLPTHKPQLIQHADRVLTVMEQHYRAADGHFPFVAAPDGTEVDLGCVCLPGHKSYSDLYACFGFLEYGVATNDKKRLALAVEVFNDTCDAINAGRFVVEPTPIPPDRILENPFSVALDLANEFAKQLSDDRYLNAGAKLLDSLLDYYLPDLGAFVEYLTPAGEPFIDDQGRYIVDPGHAIEFASFALEFCRLCEQAGKHEKHIRHAVEIASALIPWNINKGWNHQFPGICKTTDAKTGKPVDHTMPWWIPPETLLACILAYLRTKEQVHLDNFIRVHNAYFMSYINEATALGPYQNIDGKTGKPVNIIPACKFQDPEFHSGKNILTVLQLLKRYWQKNAEDKC